MFLRTIGNFPIRTVRDMHVAFHASYIYDYITELRRRQAEIIYNHEDENIRKLKNGKTLHRKYKRLNIGSIICTTVQVSKLPW
jgi:hypothetical protein